MSFCDKEHLVKFTTTKEILQKIIKDFLKRDNETNDAKIFNRLNTGGRVNSEIDGEKDEN